jgi:hypothetical protein
MRATIDGPATGSGTAIWGGCDAAVHSTAPAMRVAILPYRRVPDFRTSRPVPAPHRCRASTAQVPQPTPLGAPPPPSR